MNDQYTEISLAWRDLIGDFMMEFSEIEYISYSLWYDKINTGKPSHNFKARTKQVISQLNSNTDKNIKVLLEKAISIADKRNTIAHNPMLLQVFENKITRELHPEFAIATYIDGDYIDLPEMKEITADLIDIKTELYMTLGYLPQRQ
jgi:phosphoenolpyruvate-protein kinase (PTS system EI component)